MKLRWLVPALALLASGCIKEKMLVVVNGDGSGNIVLDTAMTTEAAAMMKQTQASFASTFGETNAAANAPATEGLINEKDLRERAKDFGEGVEFVRFKPTKDATSEGATAIYSFKDISKLRLPLQKNGGEGGLMGGGDADAAADKKPEQAVTFAFTPGATKKLVIHVPQEEKKQEKKEAAAAAKPEDKAAGGAEELGKAMGDAMLGPMMQMFKGLEMSMAVQVKGKVVKTDATNAEGDGKERAVLLSLKFDELMKSPKFAKIFEKSQGSDMPTSELLGMPGFTFESKPEVAIEFE